MKLKTEYIGEYCLLVDEKSGIKEELYVYHNGSIYITVYSNTTPLNQVLLSGYGYVNKAYCNKIIAADSRLNLDVSVLPDWREFQLERQAMDLLKNKWRHLFNFGYPQQPYPTNFENDLNCTLLGLYKEKGKWSDEDIEDTIERAIKYYTSGGNNIDIKQLKLDVIQSLEKKPTYIEVEQYTDNIRIKEDSTSVFTYKPKLITNQEGKQQVIIKELIF